MKSGLTIRHLGRESQARARGRDAAVQRLRTALLAQGFKATLARPDRLEFRRRPYLLQDDWPMQVSIRKDGRDVEVRYGAFIPWPWIVGFVATIVVVLPFAGILRADLILVAGAAAALLAAVNRQFDCRPDAPYWQRASRKRWGETIQAMLEDAFEPKAARDDG